MKPVDGPVRVWLDPAVSEAMVAEASRSGALETGGVLLGWRDKREVGVTHVVGPGPGARHERASFRPDSEWQAAKISELYELSGRRLAYLGDWHTHPGGRSWPSRLDERTLRHIATSADARCPDPVMIILGSDDPVSEVGWNAGAFALRGPSRWRFWSSVRGSPIRLLVASDSRGATDD